jgi:RND family efflux transporter MFP subunit
MDSTDKSRSELASLRIDKSKKYDDRPRGKGRSIAIALVVVVALVIGYFTLSKSITPALKVKLATATMITGSDAAANLVATGYVVAQRKAEVASKGTGRLKELNFDEGDTVNAGQVIAVLDNDDIRAALDQAKAAQHQAEVDTLNTARSYRRIQGLSKSGAVTESQLEDAETAYRSSQAALAGAAAGVRTAEVNLENTFIRAPFKGTILLKNAEVGEIVAPFASSASSKGSVVTLADMNSLEVEADVSESSINKVVIGQTCEIVLDAYPAVRYPGIVKKIVPTADRSRATVQTKVGFTQIDAKVLPEMSARVNFFLEPTNAGTASAQMLVVPKEAVTTRDGQKVVFRIQGQYVTSAPVKTGREVGRMIEITDGLAAGQQVVLSPPGKMATGDKVELSS